ncbi:MAG TPA: ABC transporter substrate-binding protein [Methanocellales archaeon]|nr:ABC transporter substrate-binding protein [Methanocellales archaeon]
MAGYEITFYKPPERVIAISRSLIDTTMYIFGVEELLVGGSYFAETSKTKYIYNGVDYTVNTQVQLVLVPKIKKLPNVGGFGSGPYGIVSTEKIASLNPDLLIVRDFCNCDEEDFNRPISIIRGLGISVVILKYLNCYDEPEVSTIYDEIELLGKIFDNQEKAAEINEYLDYQVQFITERTKEIKEEDKPRVLYFGIPSWAGEEGGTGVVFGVDQIESVLLEKVINAKNAYAGTGTPIISSEQLLALDPDIIILPTYSGYHPPREMYEEGRFANIQELRALKERRIHSLATMPCKSERLEFPINLMIEAKAVYPERFEDIDLDEWIDNYFQGLYHIDDKTVEELKKTQMLYYLEITTEK